MLSSPAIPPCAITAAECVSAAGPGLNRLRDALLQNECLLKPIRLFPLPFATVVGEVVDELPAVPTDLTRYACRNASLAALVLRQGEFRLRVADAAVRYGAARVAVVLGTSTSGIYDSEAAYVHLARHGVMPTDFHFIRKHAAQGTAEFMRDALRLTGPCYAISTACSSSAKALASAQRLLASDVCDAALVAGVDTLCRLTLRGFHSLGLIADGPAQPMDMHRRGINIGEAGAAMLLERITPDNRTQPRLLAVGETADAHHMSAPHPEGAGAADAMRQALRMGGVTAAEIGYVKLHATASPLNDLTEAKAVSHVFPNGVPCGGVKGLLGHTLGAAGALETLVGLLALEGQFLPGTCGLERLDPAVSLDLVSAPRTNQNVDYILCNSFGFGGNNACVLLAR